MKKHRLATVTDFAVPAIRTEADLIAAINGEHERAIESVRRGIEHGRRVGELLNRAKSICVHGAWEPWLKANIKFSVRSAQNYMKLAANWQELEAKTLPVADLTLRQAIAALTVSRSAEPHRGREDNLTLPGVAAAPPPALPDPTLTVPALGTPTAPVIAPPDAITAFLAALFSVGESAECIDPEVLAAKVQPEQFAQIQRASISINGLVVALRFAIKARRNKSIREAA